MDKKIVVERNGDNVKAKLADTLPTSRTVGSSVATGGGNVITGKFRELSGLLQRMQLANMAGLQYEGQRDLYTVFGYKKNINSDDYLGKYIRQDITARIIDAPPGATWSNPPEIEDVAKQAEWTELDKNVRLWQAMYRGDRLARLNPFSILLFGFDDGGDLTRPVNKGGIKELLYVRAIGARLIPDMTFDQNVKSARFGRPETYKIRFDDPATKTASHGQITAQGLKDIIVHHSRVVHVVENALEDEIFGIPIIEKVYNLLDDLLKVSGGTAETYWLTGNRGMQADIDKEMELNPDDTAALADELDEYMHQLRRVIRTRGVNLKVLESKPPSPKEVFEMIVSLISGTTGIPKRILLGSEAGQLASEQDRANWAERIDERRSLFATPNMLTPTVKLLQDVGLLTEGEVKFKWPSAFVLSPLEAAQTMAQTARAIGNISRQTGNKVPMQLTSRTEGREILGLEGDLPENEILELPEEEPTGQFGGDSSSEPKPGEES
ncbi:MAG: anti-CBASS Acb1 family protein [Dehalococcoidales bacterium]